MQITKFLIGISFFTPWAGIVLAVTLQDWRYLWLVILGVLAGACFIACHVYEDSLDKPKSLLKPRK